MALAKFLRLDTISTAGTAIDNSSFNVYKDGILLDKTGFAFTGFNTGSNPANAVFSISFNRDVDFDSYSFVVLSQTPGAIQSLTASISNDGVDYTVIDSQNEVSKGGNNLFTIQYVAPVAPATIDSLINDALDSIKTYVDSKDSSVKAYADALIAQLMQTTDLSAKIALLNQVNEILDGDSATAGFQAWESSLTRLNQIVNDFEAFKISNSNVIANGLITVTNSLNAFKGSTDIAIAQLYGRADSLNLANEKTNVDMKSAFESMKVKTALLFAM